MSRPWLVMLHARPLPNSGYGPTVRRRDPMEPLTIEVDPQSLVDPGAEELALIDAWWRAANYLAVGMIYLQDNPLLREPLRPEHIKNRLLGHWGSSPGQAFIWAHANRMIRRHDLDMIYLSGPGHGAPGVLGPTYLDGSYSAVYPDKSQDADGMRRFFKQFSFPGHIGSHCTPETPGSIHEGANWAMCSPTPAARCSTTRS